MSWYQRMAGTDVRLSNRAAERIGVDINVQHDTGVIDNARVVGATLKHGLALGALSADQVAAFTELPQGCREQVREAEALSKATMEQIGVQVERAVDEALSRMPRAEGVKSNELRAWARADWELLAVCGFGEGLGAWIRLINPAGLAVLVCPVHTLEGELGDILCALADTLSTEAMKSGSVETIRFWYERLGFSMSASSREEAKALDSLSDRQAMDWVKANDPGGFEEARFLMGDEQVDEAFCKDVCQAISAMERFCSRVDSVVAGATDAREKLERIAVRVVGCADGPLKAFVLGCCAVLGKAQTTQERVNALLPSEDFEVMPGECEILDFGIGLDIEDQVYAELNDAAWNDGEGASFPLQMDTEDLIGLLTRVSLSERLLIELSALID